MTQRSPSANTAQAGHTSSPAGGRPSPAGRPRASASPRRDARKAPPARRARLVLFAVIALGVGGAAIALVVDRLQGPAPTDVTAVQVHASMGGFDPPALEVTAGQTLRVEFASMDGPYHSDGGGWHQLAIDELGVDWKVAPESSSVFELVAPAEPGVYRWYCDICCGGKENPSMQGTLTVAA